MLSAALAAPVLLVGLAIFLVTVWDFGSVGKGTLAPWDPPRQLVRNRLYGAVRNPMYIGVLTILIGEAILFQSWRLVVYAGCIVLMFHVWVLIFEEPYLRAKFGDGYVEYCAKTPRWLPRFRSSQQNQNLGG
jgi:protein-S-isoprenylcysteine O-methyltransferase Ste14